MTRKEAIQYGILTGYLQWIAAIGVEDTIDSRQEYYLALDNEIDGKIDSPAVELSRIVVREELSRLKHGMKTDLEDLDV